VKSPPNSRNRATLLHDRHGMAGRDSVWLAGSGID
jgi:hypothetical protein